MTSPDVLLIGLGAIGTVVAGRLLASPRPPATFRILLDPARADAYRATPPSLNGIPLPLAPDAYAPLVPPPAAPRPDLLLVAVKSPALPGLLPAISAWISEKTTVISLLNGISASRLLATAVPPAQVIPAIVTCNTAMRSGRDVRQSGFFRLDLGPRLAPAPGLPTPDAIAEYLSAAPDLDAVCPPDFADALWLKFVINVGINQTEAFFRRDHGETLSAPDSLSFCRALMQEAAACAAAEGIPGAGTLPARAEAILRDCLSPRGRSSMLQDLDAGRLPETNLFAGEVTRLAALHNLPAPANQEVLRRLAV